MLVTGIDGNYIPHSKCWATPAGLGERIQRATLLETGTVDEKNSFVHRISGRHPQMRCCTSTQHRERTSTFCGLFLREPAFMVVHRIFLRLDERDSFARLKANVEQ